MLDELNIIQTRYSDISTIEKGEGAMLSLQRPNASKFHSGIERGQMQPPWACKLRNGSRTPQEFLPWTHCVQGETLSQSSPIALIWGNQ